MHILDKLNYYLYYHLTSHSTMDTSKSLDHYANRRYLLRAYLKEYALLAKEHPEVAEQLIFDGVVHFSFAHFRITEQTEGVLRVESELERMQQLA